MYDGLEGFQSARLQVHAETLSLEICKLLVRQKAVAIRVADTENTRQRFLALVGQLERKHQQVVQSFDYAIYFPHKMSCTHSLLDWSRTYVFVVI